MNALANGAAAATTGGTGTSYLLFSNNAASSGRSTLVVKDSTGYGWAKLVNATTPGALPGTVERLTLAETTPLTAAGAGNTTNFSLSTAGTLVRTAALTYATLTVDTSAGDIILDMAATALGNGTGNNGRGILMTGPNSFTVSGTTPIASGTYSPFIQHYGTGTMNWGLGINTGLSFISGGSGFINFTGAIGAGDTKFYVNGNLLRLAGTGDLGSGTGGVWVSNGGVVEIGSDLSASSDADFTCAVGNSAGNIRFAADSGISASGVDRVVNFGGAAATLTWGSNYFLTNAGNTGDTDAAFKLSSPKADATVTIVNPINLNGRDRVLSVADGSDETDAVLSGVISGFGVGVVKRGPGTLVLDGVNTYNGGTDVFQGVLRLTKASLADGSTVRISTGGTLDLSHGQTDRIGALIVNGAAQPDGIYDSSDFPGLLTGSGRLNVGGVADSGSPFDLWADANNLPAGEDGPSGDADDDGLLNLLEYATGSDPMTPTGAVLAKSPSGAITFGRALGRTDITAVLESSPDLSTGSWTTVATSTAGGAYTSAFPGSISVTETAGSPGVLNVSVTDGTTPAPAKKFYRVRVTKP